MHVIGHDIDSDYTIMIVYVSCSWILYKLGRIMGHQNFKRTRINDGNLVYILHVKLSHLTSKGLLSNLVLLH